jgi:hypothetical protein
MRNISKKRLAVIAGGTAAVMAGAGIGYAYWTTTGTADGTVGTQASLADFTVAQAAVSGTPLFPGASQSLTGTVKNGDTNAPAQLQKVVATIKAPTGVGTDSNKPECSAADYQLSSPGNTWTINASGDVATIHPNVELTKAGSSGDTFNFEDLTVTMVDRADGTAGDGTGNQDNCKGATFNITYDAS